MVTFSDEALDALEAIRRDDRFTPEKALEMARKIVARCNLLEAQPHGGYKDRVPDTFEIIVKPFIIVFEITVRDVRILNVWHGRENR